MKSRLTTVLKLLIVSLIGVMASSATVADECSIVWWDILLFPAQVKLDFFDDNNAHLTFKHTTLFSPVQFELEKTIIVNESAIIG